MKFVFVNDVDVVVSSNDAARLVEATSYVEAAAQYGISESKLRKFLSDNLWETVRTTKLVKGSPPLEPKEVEEEMAKEDPVF